MSLRKKITLLTSCLIISSNVYGVDRYPIEFSKSSYEISHEYQKISRAKRLGGSESLFDKEYSPYGGNYFLLDQYPYYPYWSDAEYWYDSEDHIIRKNSLRKFKLKDQEEPAIYKIMPYYSFTNIGDTYETTALIQKMGIYLSRYQKGVTVAFAYEYSEFGNGEGELFSAENGIVLTIGAEVVEGFTLLGGVHKIGGSKTDESYYKGNIYITDLNFSSSKNSSFGVSLYLSQYNEYDTNDEDSSFPLYGKFSVKQYSPHFGFGFENVISKSDLFYISAWLDIIDSNAPKSNKKESDNFTSAHLAVRYRINRTHFYFESWLGDQRFAIANEGYDVNNITYIKKGGAVLYLLHEFKSGFFGKFKYDISVMYDYIPAGETNDLVDQTMIFSIGYIF